MARFHLSALAAALVLAPAALSACGSGDDSSADQDQITAAIAKAATSGDPAACTEVQTQKFTEQISGGGGDAVKECEKEAAEVGAKSVDVTNVEVDGDNATADAAFTGAILDGQGLEIALVKDGDQWKLDKINSFSDFNRDAWVAGFVGQFAGDPSTPPAVVTCIKQKFQAATDEQLQAVLLEHGDELLTPCFKGQ